LLAALSPGLDPSTLPLPSGTRISRIGALTAGEPAIRLTSGGLEIALPESLGHEHRSSAPSVAGRP
jgi:thiamine-monophosphate kinase